MIIFLADVAQLVEQLICNQPVGGSNPFIGSKKWSGEIPKWPTGADCKSVVVRLRRFESFSPHYKEECGNSSVGRASAFQAEGREFESRFPLKSQCSSGVEHFLGKEEVMGSIPIIGSFFVYILIGKGNNLSIDH